MFSNCRWHYVFAHFPTDDSSDFRAKNWASWQPPDLHDQTMQRGGYRGVWLQSTDKILLFLQATDLEIVLYSVQWIFKFGFYDLRKWQVSLGVETGYPDPKGKVFLGVEISNIYGQHPRTAWWPSLKVECFEKISFFWKPRKTDWKIQYLSPLPQVGHFKCT